MSCLSVCSAPLKMQGKETELRLRATRYYVWNWHTWPRQVYKSSLADEYKSQQSSINLFPNVSLVNTCDSQILAGIIGILPASDQYKRDHDVRSVYLLSLKRSPGFHKIWNIFHAIRDRTIFVKFNFMLPIISTWRICEILRWDKFLPV